MPRYYDLSPTLGPTTPAWPTDPPVIFTPAKSLRKGGGSNVTAVAFGSHAGSHVDAPRHFYEDGASVDQLSLDILIGPAIVVEISADMIDKAALQAALPEGEIERLLLKTQNSTLWSNPKFVRNFVGLSEDAAAYLVELGVRLVGIDYLSIEAEHSTGAPVHFALLENDILIVESLDMSGVEAGEYELFCLPLKLDGLDGAPARVVLKRMDE